MNNERPPFTCTFSQLLPSQQGHRSFCELFSLLLSIQNVDDKVNMCGLVSRTYGQFVRLETRHFSQCNSLRLLFLYFCFDRHTDHCTLWLLVCQEHVLKNSTLNMMRFHRALWTLVIHTIDKYVLHLWSCCEYLEGMSTTAFYSMKKVVI